MGLSRVNQLLTEKIASMLSVNKMPTVPGWDCKVIGDNVQYSIYYDKAKRDEGPTASIVFKFVSSAGKARKVTLRFSKGVNSEGPYGTKEQGYTWRSPGEVAGILKKAKRVGDHWHKVSSRGGGR